MSAHASKNLGENTLYTTRCPFVRPGQPLEFSVITKMEVLKRVCTRAAYLYT